ncbi:MAG: hypothetical protein A6F71_06325 [Cycloclasticus sp. symbiont of Poecilosclerida sp. M]|nr:MAG: hypothetical protein A6F71_06325 [Cycloclasticus sp. symbiont of Poecilosclerida sp. M]
MRVYEFIRYQAGYITVLVALVLITPLCGLMFDCGCTWPWAGLESHCNIHNPQVVHQCPWCVSTFAGAASVGLAIALGFLASIVKNRSNHTSLADMPLPGRALITEVILSAMVVMAWRVSLGLIVFLIVAVLTGWLSGYVQDYPYFYFNAFL